MSVTQLAILRTHLFNDCAVECWAFCYVNKVDFGSRMEILVKHIRIVKPEELSHQSYTGLEILERTLINVCSRCRHEGLSLISCHSHPFSIKGTSFSCIDDSEEEKLFRFINSKLPDIWCLSMVHDRKSFDARIWDKKNEIFVPVNEVKIIGDKCYSLYSNSARRKYEHTS